MSKVTDSTSEVERAYGGCHNCYGKGYSSYITAHSGRGYHKVVDDPVFCKCERGKQLQALIDKVQTEAIEHYKKRASKWRKIAEELEGENMRLEAELNQSKNREPADNKER